MPLYEYQCSKCGNVFEVRQKFSDDPVTVHENCGGDVVKLMSAPAFQFKGSGWYVTDYAGGGSKGGAIKSETSASGDAKPATETKSESKPAETKTESKPAASTPAPSTKAD
ncbi:MAG: FmdB family zinc ribbon protein [Bryobacteraceae bacterium]